MKPCCVCGQWVETDGEYSPDELAYCSTECRDCASRKYAIVATGPVWFYSDVWYMRVKCRGKIISIAGVQWEDIPIAGAPGQFGRSPVHEPSYCECLMRPTLRSFNFDVSVV